MLVGLIQECARGPRICQTERPNYLHLDKLPGQAGRLITGEPYSKSCGKGTTRAETQSPARCSQHIMRHTVTPEERLLGYLRHVG